jgi:hypothetical protein
MMKKKNIQLFIAAILIGGFISVQAQNAKPMNVITTAVPFLRISADARANGMGDIGLATSADASAGFRNLGKLPFNTMKGGMVANYIPWLKDIVNDMYLASAAGYYKLDENQAINGSLRYFSLGDLQFTDNSGNHLNSFRPREFGIDMGYSRKLSGKSGIGVGLKYIHSQLANKGSGNNDYKAGNAVAADIGYYYNNVNSAGNGWSFGGALTNLGSKISYSNNANEKDFIPANLGLGAAYTKLFNDQNKITVGIDINKLLVPTPPAIGDSAAMVSYRSKTVLGSWFSSFGDAPGGVSEELREFQASVGAEYWYNNQFAFRAGYFFEDKTKGNRKFFTMGAGIKYYFFTLNFSYLFQSGAGIDRNPLSNTLCFGLQFDFKN